jgi:hypothetical protein
MRSEPLGSRPDEERIVLKAAHKERAKLERMKTTLPEQHNQWKVMGLRELGAATDRGELVIDHALTLFYPLNDPMTEPARRELYEKQSELMMFDFLYTPMSEWGDNA